jgi:hypothetical protein
MMKQLFEHNPSLEQSSDFPAIVTVICHLMTLYAKRPCEQLAVNITRHMNALLSTSIADSLGSWRSTFQQRKIRV